MAIAYQRGFDGKPKPRYATKGSLVEKKWLEGKSDRENNLPHRYIKDKNI